jgi:hypothetical protein
MVALIVIALAVLYCGLFYAASGAQVTTERRPANVVASPKFFCNVVLGVVLLFLVDGAVFHSGLYQYLLEPQSYAGVISRGLRAEKHRPSFSAREVLVLGDSRIGRGFSETIANETAAAAGVAFVKRAFPLSTPRLWYYYLREVDPTAARYRAIVIPVRFEEGRLIGAVTEIAHAAFLLRYSDAWVFASSFPQWKDQCKAFMACLLRGTALQPDLWNFLEHPAQRLKRLREAPLAYSERFYRDDNDFARDRTDMTGVSFDPVSKTFKFPAGKPWLERDRARYEESIDMLEHPRWSASHYQWTKRILERYAHSSSSIILVELPKSPFASEITSKEAPPFNPRELAADGKAMLVEDSQFAFLERPEYFADYRHLNAHGRTFFTRRLSEEVLARLQISAIRSTETDATQSVPH